MGIAANKFRYLFLATRKSGIEYEISQFNQQRVFLMNQSESLASEFARSIYDSGKHSDLYDGEIPGLLPGMSGNLPGFTPADETPMSESEYESKMSALQSEDVKYEILVRKLESVLEASKTEMESVYEILKKNNEKEYNTFNNG